MNFRIVKKDLTKKKSINIILTVFILLATMFIASSINNFMVVTKGLDNYFDMEGLDDYFVFTMEDEPDKGKENRADISEFLDKSKNVKEYSKYNIVYISKQNMSLENGGELEMASSMLFSSFNISAQKFFDYDNKEIKDMENGTIYIPKAFYTKNNMKKGGIISVKTSNGYSKSFTIKGYFMDALLGSDMMGTKRFIISEEDFEDMYENSGLPVGEAYSIKTDTPDDLKNEMSKESFTSIFSDGKALIKTSYIMDMIVAAILLIVSVCLIVISIVMLRFIIVFNINEEFRQIGIMKAIGIRNGGIRRLYVAKFFVLSIIGAVLGFIGSIPFNRIMQKHVSRNIILLNTRSNIVLSILISIMVAAAITGFAYLSTRRIKKLSPMDAIRNGNTGERFKKKSPFRLHNSRAKTTTFMAANDIFSELKKFIVLLITGIVGIWLVVVPINTINTLRSDKIINWFSMLDCDLYIADDAGISDVITKRDRTAFEDYITNVKEKLEENGIETDRVFIETLYNLSIKKDDISTRSISKQGIGTHVDEYALVEGSAPKYENEILLAEKTKSRLKAKIGDKVKITLFGEDKEFIVSGFFEDMNNMGEGIRFHEDMVLDCNYVSGAFSIQVVLKDKVNGKELEKVMDRIKDIFDGALVMDTSDFISSMIGNIPKLLGQMKYLIIGIVLTINVLIVILMQKMFLIREKNKMATLKAIGFSNKSIIFWQTKRIFFVLTAGEIIGICTGKLITGVTSGRIFKMMGAPEIEYVIKPAEVYFGFPIAILLITVLGCIITMQKVRKITVSDINVVE